MHFTTLGYLVVFLGHRQLSINSPRSHCPPSSESSKQLRDRRLSLIATRQVLIWQHTPEWKEKPNQ